MKKIFLLLLFVACVCVSNAQNKKKVRYQGEVLIGYGLGTNYNISSVFNLHTIQGIRVGEYFSTGIGVGMNVASPPSGCVLAAYMPLYLNARGYLPVGRKVKLFVSTDIGVSFISMETKFMINPALGVKLKLKDKKGLLLSVGYDYQDAYKGGTINFRFGVQF